MVFLVLFMFFSLPPPKQDGPVWGGHWQGGIVDLGAKRTGEGSEVPHPRSQCHCFTDPCNLFCIYSILYIACIKATLESHENDDFFLSLQNVLY